MSDTLHVGKAGVLGRLWRPPLFENSNSFDEERHFVPSSTTGPVVNTLTPGVFLIELKRVEYY